MSETRDIKLDYLTQQTGNPNCIIGHAAVFDSPSEPLEIRGRKVTEFVRSTAFDRSLLEGSDVAATINHDLDRRLLGRTSSGTLKLEKDQTGLRFKLNLPDTSYAKDLSELIRRGDVAGASFRFEPVSEKWNEARTERYLEDLNLVDIAITSHPAYSAADIGFDFRSLAFLVSEIRAGKRISADTEEQLRHAIDTLTALLEGEDDTADEGLGEGVEQVSTSDRSISILRKKLELAEMLWQPYEQRDLAYVPAPYHADPDETIQCPECGSMNDSDAQYCDQCGTALAGLFIVEDDEPV